MILAVGAVEMLVAYTRHTHNLHLFEQQAPLPRTAAVDILNWLMVQIGIGHMPVAVAVVDQSLFAVAWSRTAAVLVAALLASG